MKRLHIYFLSLLSCSSLIASSDYWMTIFVHGSFSLRPHLSFKNAFMMLEDKIEDSVYYRSTEISRRDPFFHKNQAMLELGFHKIDFKHPNKLEAARIIAQQYEKISTLAGNPPCQEYYTYGWSGLVSNKLRYLEAELFYKKLSHRVHELKAQGYNPKVRILSYSHGGNLCLQMGAIHVKTPPTQQFFIDEFYTFGTPIQTETDYLINSPIFKKVYNIYSKGDSIQKLDFFSFKRFFSRRRFEPRMNFEIPDKLTQIRVRVTEYTPRKKGDVIPLPKDEAKLHKYFKEVNYDPGHFELWFMGWTILTYREDFPLNPLPFCLFAPYIVKYIEDEPHLTKDLIVQLQPLNETVSVYNYKQPRNRKIKNKVIRPFISKTDLEKIKDETLQYEPGDYNLEVYNRKMFNAIDTAQHEYNQLKKIKREEEKAFKKYVKPLHEHKAINLHSKKNKKETIRNHLE
jgi:hypothetical protein